MIKLFLALCTLILFSPWATASTLYDELAAAKLKFLGTQRPAPGMGLWAKQTNEMLMYIIEGKWIDLGYSDITTEDSMNDYCTKFGAYFKRVNTYTFEMAFPPTRPKIKEGIHKGYTFKTGMLYNYQWNIEQQMAVLGNSEPNSTQILRNATGTSALMMMTPNILLEVDFDQGTPYLWGRCPTK